MLSLVALVTNQLPLVCFPPHLHPAKACLFWPASVRSLLLLEGAVVAAFYVHQLVEELPMLPVSVLVSGPVVALVLLVLTEVTADCSLLLWGGEEKLGLVH